MIKITSRNFVIQAVDQIGNLQKFAIFEFMAAVGKQHVLENKLNFPPRYYMAILVYQRVILARQLSTWKFVFVKKDSQRKKTTET